MNAAPASGEPLGWREKLGYAAGDTASCLYYQTFALFLLIFYTDTYGLAPAVAGTMFLVTRTWDALIDPVVGLMADRTKTRHGKFRPWILWGLGPFAVLGVLVFVTPPLPPAGKVVYAYATYTLVMLAYSVVNVPYGALLGVISPRPEERTKLASYRFVGAFVGGIIVQASLLALVRRLGGGDDRLGYPLAVAVFAGLAGLLFLGTFLATTERVCPPPGSQSVVRDLRDLGANPPWVVLSLMGLVTLVYLSVRNGATLYYFKYYLRDEAAAAPFLVTGTLFSMVGALLAPAASRIAGGKKAAFVALTVASAAALAVFHLVRPGQWVLLYACHIVFSVPSAALFPLLWSMYADTADYGEWRHGRRATGLVFSAATFAQKMGWAVGSALTGFLLTLVGFVANAAQGPATLAGLRAMMSFVPAVLALVVAGLALAYGLDAETERRVGAELRARGRA